jgi:hypothetical protein
MRRPGAEFIVTAAAATGLIALGIHRAEFRETLLNAALICLSCIGIR